MTEEPKPPASPGGQEPPGSGTPPASGQEPKAGAKPPAGQGPKGGDGPSREELLQQQLATAQADVARLQKDLVDERQDAGRHRVANKGLQEQVTELRGRVDASDERARTAELRAALIPRLGDPARVDLALKVIRDDPSYVDETGAVKVKELLEKYPALAPSSAVGPANPAARGSEPDLSQAIATHNPAVIRKAFFEALDKEKEAVDARRASTSQGTS